MKADRVREPWMGAEGGGGVASSRDSQSEWVIKISDCMLIIAYGIMLNAWLLFMHVSMPLCRVERALKSDERTARAHTWRKRTKNKILIQKQIGACVVYVLYWCHLILSETRTIRSHAAISGIPHFIPFDFEFEGKNDRAERECAQMAFLHAHRIRNNFTVCIACGNWLHWTCLNCALIGDKRKFCCVECGRTSSSPPHRPSLHIHQTRVFFFFLIH